MLFFFLSFSFLSCSFIQNAKYSYCCYLLLFFLPSSSSSSSRSSLLSTTISQKEKIQTKHMLIFFLSLAPFCSSLCTCVFFFSCFLSFALDSVYIGLLSLSLFRKKRHSSDMYVCVRVSDFISLGFYMHLYVCVMMSSSSIINISYEHTDDDKQTKKRKRCELCNYVVFFFFL